MDPLVAGVLTPAQQGAVDFIRALNVNANWYVGVPSTADRPDGRPVGTVEVIALGDDFVWAILVQPDGETHTSEARVG